MNSIQAMEKEIEFQKTFLTNISLPKSMKPEDCFFVGNGDSFVAGLISYYASNSIAQCCTPYDIISIPKIVHTDHVFLISLSGNIRSSVYAARILKEKSIETTAITANRKSQLAKICDNILELEYPSIGISTAGTIGFTTTTLTCLALIGRYLDKDISKIYDKAMKISKKFNSIVFKDRFYIFLAENMLYPLCIYGALKMNEIFGFHSGFYHIDEFAHAPLFGIKSNDYLFVLGGNNIKKAEIKYLVEGGLNVAMIDIKGSPLEVLLASIFIEQFILLYQAKKKNLRECHFLKNKKYLKISSNIIYCK
jgi:glucosamine 6-phosphate synthetase-like amidotransferase/phosphosugar isomerase protein